jgi:anti-anti-sigma factor
VNINNADKLRDAASQAHANGARYVLLDLTDVPAMTSDGLRALHSIYLLFDDEQGGAGPTAYMKLLNPSSHVRLLLDTAGFAEVIEMYDDWQSAIDSF